MPTATSSPLTLYTIAMSHYSEKIRWLLDVEGYAYREVALTPVFHIRPALLMGRRGQTTVPFLRSDHLCIQDSTRIIEWLDRERGPLSTLPIAQRAEIMEIEARFDAIGKDVARYLYYAGFEHNDLIQEIWTRFATPGQTRFINWAYPMIKAAFKVKLSINASAARRAEHAIDTNLRWLEERLASGQRYLVADRLTVADITAAALLAPMACPIEHPIYGSEAFRTHLHSPNPLWQNRAGLAWVRSIYAEHRGPVWRELPRAA